MLCSKDLRTGADLVSDLTSDLADVKTVGEARAAAETIRQRFGRTGVYRDVRVLTEDSASGRGVDLVVELDESTLRAEQGVTRSGNGAISTSTNVALSNIMGWGEQWSLNLGASAGEGALVSGG